MGVGASGSGTKGARALKTQGFFDEAAVEALAAENQDAKATLEQHAAGNFTTDKVTVQAVDLDDADKAFIEASFFTADERSVIASMVGFTAETQLSSEKGSLNCRCIPAASSDAPLRVALCLHGMGDDRTLALWSKFWPALHAQGFHIVALDFPGYGRASGQKGDYKSWTDMDAELLLRLVAALKLPPGCITVFAEGIGGVAFIRAIAQDPTPFAPHHVLLNVQIGSLPSNLAEALDAAGATVYLCVCEVFYEGQTPWLVASATKLLEFLTNPSAMGQYGPFTIWHVRDPDVAKRTGGSGILGLTPFKSMKDGAWWVGKPHSLRDFARGTHVMIFAPSDECLEEMMQHITAPRRTVRSKEVNTGPEKSAIEMGEINENFQVFIRVRPLLQRETDKGAKNCFVITDTDFPRDPPPQRIVVQETAGEEHVKGNYVFNRVFDLSYGQSAVYAGTARAYVNDFLAGTNVTIFAYGQTGTGKTHTIMGPEDDTGIIPRCLSDIFRGMPAGKRLCYEYVQLYMDEFKDLLVEESKTELKLVDSKAVGVHLPGLTRVEATSEADVLRALAEGSKRRATRAQDMNQVSSRSHAILMLRLMDGNETPAADAPATTMFIVDLAGSERIARSGVSGQGFDEATSINQSLTSLGRVVVALIDSEGSSKSWIPYSSSPLTMVLKGGLGGNSKTCLIACVTQAADSINESVSTLRFAMRASHVKNKVDKQGEKDKADAEKAKIASSGNTVSLTDGKGTLSLPSGELEVLGSWDEAVDLERTAILLADLNKDPSTLQGLIDALSQKGCRVLAPKLPAKAEKEIEKDMEALTKLLDYVGIPQAVVYGRDWGAIRACKLKISAPKRIKHVILENFDAKVDEKEYKARTKKDPMYCMNEFGIHFLWFVDGAFPKSLDAKPGVNLKGFKGPATFLWPFHFKGRHDKASKSSSRAMAEMYARLVKTKPTDSFLMTDSDVADKIVGCF